MRTEEHSGKAAAGPAFHVHHDVERIADIGLDRAVGQLDAALQDAAGEAGQSRFRGVRVNGRERARVAGEVGADIFASELIYSEPDLRSDVERMEINRGECSAKLIRRLRGETQTTLPYKVLAERAASMGFVFKREYWKQLEEWRW